MSQWFGLRAVAWVLDEAPDVPPNLVATLIGVARHAGDDGRNAFPSVETLMGYTRKSRRQVKYDLADLAKRGLIVISADQGAANKVRADRRPTVYELPLSLKRDATCNPLHPVERGATDCTSNDPRGATERTTGCNTASDDVQPIAPEEAVEDSKEKINQTSSPYPLASDLAVVDAEIMEEGEDPTSSLQHQTQTLVDEIRAIRPSWSPAELRTHITGAMNMLGASFDAAAEVARRTARDPASARPSRITASGNPHLQAASTAFLIAKVDATDHASLPLHPGAHPFEPGGSANTCQRCTFPEANQRHRVSARNQPRYPRNEHVPYLNPAPEDFATAYDPTKL